MSVQPVLQCQYAESGFLVVPQIFLPHHPVFPDGSPGLLQFDIRDQIIPVPAVSDLSHALFPPCFLLSLVLV